MVRHLAAVVVLWAVVCLPNLGGPSLWDIDEPNNMECTREMLESGNLVVPTFNYALRTDKPALIYWLQMAAASVVGMNEWAARLPSALATLVTLMGVYALGRRMFSPLAGLLAAAVLATSPGAVAAARFANPDALLLACTTLTLGLFWDDYARGGRGSLAAAGLFAGLGVLAKGPVGFVLPAAVVFLFLAWRGQLRRLLDVRVLGLIGACLLVALPWYVWVAAETRGAWPRGFFMDHNARRFTSVMESHSGPIVYYLIVLFPGLMPWSIFLAPACVQGWMRRRDPAHLFLLAWAAVYVVFFSLAATKLPNYVLPAYPALALLMGRFLERWLAGEAVMPAWAERGGLIGLGVGGVGLAIGLMVAGGQIAVPGVRTIDGLASWAGMGLILTGAAALASWHLDGGRRDRATATLTAAGVLFLLLAGAFVAPVVDRSKAPKALAAVLPADLHTQDARIAAWDYFQPSLVFYCRREVLRCDQLPMLIAHLDQGHPAYAFLPEASLPQLERRRRVRVLGRAMCMYVGRTVVLVANH